MGNKWTKMDVVPKANLEAWNHYDDTAGLSANNLITDASGNSRNLTSGAGNAAVLTPNVFNGHHGWYFNGSRDPLAWSGTVTMKHVFILASFEEAAFTEFRGLLTGVSGSYILTSENTGDEMIVHGPGVTPSEYYKSGVLYVPTGMKAPMGGAFAVIEAKVDNIQTVFNGIQVGQNGAFTAQKHKGHFIDLQAYSVDQTELAVSRLYEYYAMRYNAWRTNAAGLKIFPFAANKNRSEEYDQEHYLSDPYEGDSKALVRGLFEGGYSLQFLLRRQEEFEAAKAFYKLHYPLGKFVFRDYRYYPYKDITCQFTSPLREQGSDVSYRFNYSVEIKETT